VTLADDTERCAATTRAEGEERRGEERRGEERRRRKS
jgi:hypothetical protein